MACPAPSGTKVSTIQSFCYKRRLPEEATLYQIVQENWLTFLEQIEDSGGLPDFVKKEFEEYLKCGILAHGFLRVKCGSCKHERLVGFSCKRRGFCPSCGSKRMCEHAALLVDHVIPDVPIRQWVLSLPFQIRYLLAAEPKAMGEVLKLIHRAISGFLINKSGHTRSKTQTGAVTLIQRFGGSVNLNIHYHILALDGAYTFATHTDGNKWAAFHRTHAPTKEELIGLVKKIAHRVTRYLEKAGYIVRDQDTAYLRLDDHDGGFDRLQAASITYRAAFGPRAGQKVLTLGTQAQVRKSKDGFAAQMSGFSLHAGVACNKGERKKLEHICRYISRPPVAEERLRRDHRGQVVYELKRPYDDGTTHLLFSPLEFMERLASLVPRPRVNLSRYHGLFAPHAKYRKLITPTPPKTVESEKDMAADSDKPRESKYRISWARLLKRVFDMDLSKCQACGGEVRVIAAVLLPSAIKKILQHLKQATDPPTLTPARAPPIFGNLDPFADDIQAFT